ncbi:MAG: type II toxin-antitoxin system HicB family antitoxin [Tepidiformaceae bacterium]
MTNTEFNAVFERRPEWYIGWVEELPGAFGQGKTLEEAREGLREAIVLIIEANRELVAARPNDERVRERIAVTVP